MRGTVDMAQRRIEYAFRKVSEWPPGRRRTYANRVQGLPIELRNQGLVVVVATLKKDGHAALAESISRWLLEEAPTHPLRRWESSATGDPIRRLLGACVAADRPSYLAAQAEALALAEHIKRFAGALVGDEAVE